jgi:hypothetical protein
VLLNYFTKVIRLVFQTLLLTLVPTSIILNDLAGSDKFELLSRPKTVARLISVLAFQKASLAALKLLQTCYLRA